MLGRADAIRVVDSVAELAAAWESLLADPKARRELGSRAREVVLQQKGATDRTVTRIAAMLKTSTAVDPRTAGSEEVSQNQERLVSEAGN